MTPPRNAPPGRPRARPSATSHATVTVTGPSPPRTGQHDYLGAAGGASRHSGFQQPGTLDGRRASSERCRSLPVGGLGRYRTIPHAGTLNAAASPVIFSAVVVGTFRAAGRRAAA